MNELLQPYTADTPTSSPWRNYSFLLAIIIFFALAGRLALAPWQEYEMRSDITLFQLWGWHAAEYGLSNVYDTFANIHTIPESIRIAIPHYAILQNDINYLPPTITILWTLEKTRQYLFPNFLLGSVGASVLYKLPAIIADIATLLLLSSIVRKKSGNRPALIVAAIYAIHPFIWYISAGFGQIDSIYTFFAVLAVWLIERQRLIGASAALTISYFFKMQAVAFAPLLIYELIQKRSLRLILKAVGVSVGVAIIINAPFIFTGQINHLLTVIFSAPGYTKALSMWALNFWWIIVAIFLLFGIYIDDKVLLFKIPLLAYGLILYGLMVLGTLILTKMESKLYPWLTAAALAFAFWLFPTEIHERYLFPVFAMLAVILPLSPAARKLFMAISATVILNYIYIMFRPWPLGVPWLTIIIAIFNLGLFGVFLWLLKKESGAGTEVHHP